MPVAIELNAAEQERYRRSHRISAAVKAALIAAAILWIFPSGQPWTSYNSPSGAYIMGRPVAMDQSITMLSVQALPAHLGHFGVAILYSLIILAVVYRLRTWRALLAGVVTGLVLYGVNYLAFRMIAPQFTGPWEFNVGLAHALFGGLAAGMIRGFLRPPVRVDPDQPNPGPKYP
jgi:hypothetical protein